jgi:hypothetical protein
LRAQGNPPARASTGFPRVYFLLPQPAWNRIASNQLSTFIGIFSEMSSEKKIPRCVGFPNLKSHPVDLVARQTPIRVFTYRFFLAAGGMVLHVKTSLPRPRCTSCRPLIPRSETIAPIAPAPQVYLMPSEVMVSQGDMPRDLAFVTHGILDQMSGDSVIRTVRGDTEAPSVAGEVAFFMGMPQPYTIQCAETLSPETLVRPLGGGGGGLLHGDAAAVHHPVRRPPKP